MSTTETSSTISTPKKAAPKKAAPPTKSKNALTGLKRTMFGMNPEDITIIGIDTEHGKGDHPLWDKRVELPVDEGLVRSIMEHGVLQTVTVRKNDGVAELVIGRQRVRAAREANRRLADSGKKPIVINVVTVRGTDREMAGLMVTENELRVNTSQLEKAEMLRGLVELYEYTDKEAAEVFGVTQTAIRNWKKLWKCADEVLEAVNNGEMSASAAADLTVFEPEEQARKLEALRAEAASSAKAKKAKKASAPSGSSEPTTDEPAKRPKISNQATRNARRKATGSSHATSHKPPRKPLVTSVVVYAQAPETKHSLSSDAIDILRWTLGEIPAEDVPGLTETLEQIDLRKKGENLKLTEPQEAIIEDLKTAPKLKSEMNLKVLGAMFKKDIVEEFKADDGTVQVKLTDLYHQIVAAMTPGEGVSASDDAA